MPTYTKMRDQDYRIFLPSRGASCSRGVSCGCNEVAGLERSQVDEFLLRKVLKWIKMV